MQFTREIQRLVVGLLVVFAIIALAAAYWGVAGAESLLLRSDNARLFESQAAIVRGEIVDRNEVPLVVSVSTPGGRIARDFLDPAMNSIAGYYSLRYGVGGAEAAYNSILRGDDLPRDLNSHFQEDVLHQPRHGSDVKLTLNLQLQQAVAEAMKGRQGAAVVLDVPSGEVLALVSLPTFDPNHLDEHWEQLIKAPEQPFFNRVLQGRYQPGGILQTPLLVAAMLEEYPLDQLEENAVQPLELDGLSLNCALPPPAPELTLAQAYAFACPMPFATMFNQIDPLRIQEAVRLFRLETPYTLPGFIPTVLTDASLATPEPTPTATGISSTLTLDNALGQGSLTLSPLDVAAMTAAIVNEGNAPQPVILLGTRPPGSADWLPVDMLYPSTPVTTAEISRKLQELMRDATRSGGATRAAREGLNIGGHAALAYSGQTTGAWFTGFIITGSRQGIVVALVLESESDPTEAAALGGQILEAAFKQSVVPTGS